MSSSVTLIHRFPGGKILAALYGTEFNSDLFRDDTVKIPWG